MPSHDIFGKKVLTLFTDESSGLLCGPHGDKIFGQQTRLKWKTSSMGLTTS